MVETNVLGLLRMTRLVLPHMEDWRGHIVNLGSWAGRESYAGGGMYVGTKTPCARSPRCCARSSSAASASPRSIPGMVGDTEFSDVRFRGDAEKKDAVYRGVRYLTPDDVADCILWAVTRPEHMVVDEIVVKPLQQASQDAIVRGGLARDAADDPRGLDVLRLRRARRHLRADDGPLRPRHALPLALGADHQRRAAAHALLAQGRVLLGRLLPAEPGRRRPRARRDLDRARALHRRRDAGALVVSNHAPRRVAFDLALEIGNDFADIFAVKAYDFALGDPDHARRCPPRVSPCTRRTTTSSSSPQRQRLPRPDAGRPLRARRGRRTRR